MTISFARPEQGGQIVLHQVADAVDGDVRGRILRQGFGVVGVMSLTRKDGREATAPGFLHGCQDAQLVVDQHIVLGRVAFFDVLQLLLLVNVDQHPALDGLEQAGAKHLARLKNHVAVGENDGRPQLANVFDRVHGAGKEAVGKRVIGQKTD